MCDSASHARLRARIKAVSRKIVDTETLIRLYDKTKRDLAAAQEKIAVLEQQQQQQQQASRQQQQDCATAALVEQLQQELLAANIALREERTLLASTRFLQSQLSADLRQAEAREVKLTAQVTALTADLRASQAQAQRVAPLAARVAQLQQQCRLLRQRPAAPTSSKRRRVRTECVSPRDDEPSPTASGVSSQCSSSDDGDAPRLPVLDAASPALPAPPSPEPSQRGAEQSARQSDAVAMLAALDGRARPAALRHTTRHDDGAAAASPVAGPAALRALLDQMSSPGDVHRLVAALAVSPCFADAGACGIVIGAALLRRCCTDQHASASLAALLAVFAGSHSAAASLSAQATPPVLLLSLACLLPDAPAVAAAAARPLATVRRWPMQQPDRVLVCVAAALLLLRRSSDLPRARCLLIDAVAHLPCPIVPQVARIAHQLWPSCIGARTRVGRALLSVGEQPLPPPAALLAGIVPDLASGSVEDERDAALAVLVLACAHGWPWAYNAVVLGAVFPALQALRTAPKHVGDARFPALIHVLALIARPVILHHGPHAHGVAHLRSCLHNVLLAPSTAPACQAAAAEALVCLAGDVPAHLDVVRRWKRDANTAS